MVFTRYQLVFFFALLAFFHAPFVFSMDKKSGHKNSFAHKMRASLRIERGCIDLSSMPQHDRVSVKLHPNIVDDIFDHIDHGRVDPLVHLLKGIKEAIYDKKGRTPLYRAAYKGHQTVVEKLLYLKQPVNGANFRRLLKTKARNLRRSIDTSGRTRDRSQTLPNFPESADRDPNNVTSLTKVEKKALIERDVRRSRLLQLSDVNLQDEYKFEDGTPIFALARKPELKPVDIATARRLFSFDADLTITDASGKTVITLLEERLARLVKKSVPTSSRRGSKYELAKTLFGMILADKMFENRFSKIWVAFASSAWTARIFEEFPGEKLAIRKSEIYSDFINWQIDLTLPSPESAYASYLRAKSFMPPEDQLIMLLNFLVAHAQVQTRELVRSASVVKYTISDIEKIDTSRVARVIFDIHRELFLAVKPNAVAIKSVRDEIDPALNHFLDQMNRLPRIIEDSIVVQSERPDKTFSYWKTVGIKLVELGDLLGAWCIRTALASIKVERVVHNRNLDGLPNLQAPKVYVNEKSKRAVVIPSLIHEGADLTIHLENRLTVMPHDEFFGESSSSVKALISSILLDIENRQNALKSQSAGICHPAPLCDFFRDIPWIDEKGTEMLSLNSASRSRMNLALDEQSDTFAETWDTVQLHDWITRQSLSVNTGAFVQSGISDGPSLLEKYVVNKSRHFIEIDPSAFAIFRYYENFCAEHDTTPLGNLCAARQFPTKLFEFPDNSFHWIMWLRNNGLSDIIVPLTNANVRNFQQFLHAKQSYRQLAITDKMHIKKLDDLLKLVDLLKKDLPPIVKWRRKHIRAWLVSNGLSHFMPKIRNDKMSRADNFLALFYVYQQFKFKTIKDLGYDGTWISVVFDELNKDHKLDKEVNKLPWPEGVQKYESSSRLFFIRALNYIGAHDSIPRFYAAKIMTLQDAKLAFHLDSFEISAPPSDNPLRLELSESVAEKYGLTLAQSEQLKNILNKYFFH